MDAANLSLKRIALPFAFALLIPAAAYAQQFSASTTSLILSGSTAGNITVTSTTTPTTEIPFQASATYTAGDPAWLCLNNMPTTVTGLTTPATVTVSVGNCGVNLGLFTGTHTASITLHSTLAGVTDVSINVSYTVGSGGGGGTGAVTASPASINQTVSYGSLITVTFNLTTSSTTPISFTLGSPSVNWASWSQLSGNSGSVSFASPATIGVTLNGAGQLQAALTTTLTVNAATGTVNIPVTLNNGVSGGGGGTGTLSVSPTLLSWSYSTANPGTFPASTTLSLSSTNGAVGYSALTTSSNGWLLVNNGFFASGTIGTNALTVSSSGNLAALAVGTYSGTVTITELDNSAIATVNVTVTVTGTNSGTLTISPNPISLTAALNGSIAQTSVTITSAVSGTLSASVSGTGLSVSGSGQSVTAGVATIVTIFGNPAGLTNSTYVGTLSVNVGGNSASAQINFVVGTGSSGGGTSTAGAPTQLNFYYEQNTSMQISQSQQLYLSGSGNFSISSSTASLTPNWLTASVASGSLPGTVTITANATNLAAGTYNGQLTLLNVTNSQTAVVNVTLLVTGVTTIYASPGDWVFSYIAGVTSTSQSQGIEVLASDSSVIPVSATVTNAASTPWLSVTASATTTPLIYNVIANASGLANGVYTGSITVSGGNNGLTIPIVLVVSGSSVSGSGPLTLGASALTLQAQVNGATVSQTLSVGASTSTTFTATSQGSYNGINWLSVSPFGTSTTPTTLTITANPAGLPIGNYSGTISLVANSVTQTVQVTLVVGTTAGTSVTVTANGGSSTSPTLTFTAAAVGATVATQYLTISSAAGQSSVAFTVSSSTTSGGNWIQLGTVLGQQYTTPLTPVNVTVLTTGLAAGTYNGQVTITPVGGTAVNVPVVLTISGAPTIGVSTSSLSFSYQAGAAVPNTQSVPVTISSGTSATFTATAASTPAGWLVVTPATGTAPSSLTVSITPTGLAAGTYTGTITVAGSGGATGTATVTVTLTVTVPLPTVTAVVNAASFVNGPISPGEIITIGGTNIGPATPASLTLDSTGKFVTTTLGNVQVLINGFAAPLLYVSATQINAVVPYEIAGLLSPTVLVKFLGQSSNGFTVNMAATAPGIFTANGSGTGPGAILNADNSSNVTTAAARGTVVQVYLTGEGQTSPAGVDGKVTTAPYPGPLLPIAISVGGQPANYQFAGEAPALVSGVMQLNVLIPATLAATGNVPLVVTIGSNSTQGGVTVNIR